MTVRGVPPAGWQNRQRDGGTECCAPRCCRAFCNPICDQSTIWLVGRQDHARDETHPANVKKCTPMIWEHMISKNLGDFFATDTEREQGFEKQIEGYGGVAAFHLGHSGLASAKPGCHRFLGKLLALARGFQKLARRQLGFDKFHVRCGQLQEVLNGTFHPFNFYLFVFLLFHSFLTAFGRFQFSFWAFGAFSFRPPPELRWHRNPDGRIGAMFDFGRSPAVRDKLCRWMASAANGEGRGSRPPAIAGAETPFRDGLPCSSEVSLPRRKAISTICSSSIRICQIGHIASSFSFPVCRPYRRVARISLPGNFPRCHSTLHLFPRCRARANATDLDSILLTQFCGDHSAGAAEFREIHLLCGWRSRRREDTGGSERRPQPSTETRFSSFRVQEQG